ncbi:D-alanyl-D-alanine carboxypeptidase family protein [Cellulomonas sp. NPDC058312]|uniref:M15 family metallopeptidase n=1 Tax=Cellulomonas sp. NPDC058312 TaxID=3346441 RepID=UPI0036F036BB
MTSRPPRARRTSTGGRVAPADERSAAPRTRWTGARTVQVLSTVAVGSLTVGLLLHDVPSSAPEPPQVAADAPADPSPRPRAVPTAGRTAPPTTPAPTVPTGPADRAGDLLAGPSAPSAPAPTAPLRVPLPPAAAGLDLARYATTDPASPWVVVNKALPLAPADFAPTDLVVVGGYEVRAALQDPLTRMLAAAAAEGVRLELRSGFRSAAYQQQVHADWASRVGPQRVDEVSARPGHSEHQTGLAVDVGSGSRPECDFQSCFDATPEGTWVAARAAEFGFVVRYTAGNQAVTGYAPEGWHLRYVGTDLVAEMQRRGVTTLEELFGVPGGPDYR